MTIEVPVWFLVIWLSLTVVSIVMHQRLIQLQKKGNELARDRLRILQQQTHV